MQNRSEENCYRGVFAVSAVQEFTAQSVKQIT